MVRFLNMCIDVLTRSNRMLLLGCLLPGKENKTTMGMGLWLMAIGMPPEQEEEGDCWWYKGQKVL